MDNRIVIRGMQPFVLIFVLFALMFACMVITYQVVVMTLGPLFGIAHAADFIRNPTAQFANTPAALYLQAIISGLGIFILPSVLFHLILNKRLGPSTRIDRGAASLFWWMSVPMMINVVLFLPLLVQLVQHIPLPSGWESMRDGQHEADSLIDSFFGDKSLSRYFLLVFVLAVMPAIGEELCFRGTIQNLLAKTNLGSIGAVIVTGLCFSMMHLEFDNFLAIWGIGILLGLMYHYSGSLWIPIFGHFINNFITVTLKYLIVLGTIPAWVGEDKAIPWYISLLAGFGIFAGVVVFKKKRELIAFVNHYNYLQSLIQEE